MFKKLFSKFFKASKDSDFSEREIANDNINYDELVKLTLKEEKREKKRKELEAEKKYKIRSTPKEFYPEDTERYKLNANEQDFLNEFFKQISTIKISKHFYSRRMSDGTIDMQWRGMQIGRINFRNNKCEMQILLTDLDAAPEEIDGSLKECIEAIPCWIEYLIFLKNDG